MARLAISQKTITDITDGYTVNLVPNAGTFSTNNSKTCEAETTFTIAVNAWQGSSSISSTVEVDLNNLTVNKLLNGSTGTAPATYYTVTATSGDGNVKKFPLTITVHTACQADALLFNIPVYVEGTPTNNPDTTTDDVVMNITFVATGSQTGRSGTNGESSYTWIRYANSDEPTWAETSDDPDGMTYIGFAKTTTNVQPTTPSSYDWSKFVGTDGTNGTNGTNGEDGKPGYTFIVKSSNGDVFRNNSGTTNIILYIYKADMQHMTGSEFEAEVGGTLRCFKDSVPDSGSTGEVTIDKTEDDYFVTISASNITNVASYFWILEEA